MLENKQGQKVPSVKFKVQVDNEWEAWSSERLFANKKIVVFSLPGAFTPTCSSSHLPRYNELASVFKAENIDAIFCISVNDTFVMNAWKKDQDAENIVFIPDGNGDFTSGMGMLVDKSAIGFGKRSWRYSMLVNDGVIEKMFIEPDVQGDPFEVSDADTMLNYINPEAKVPASITIMSKPGCPHCNRAKDLLEEHELHFEEIELGSNGLSYSALKAVSGRTTTPQIYVDGEHIGGADELENWLD